MRSLLVGLVAAILAIPSFGAENSLNIGAVFPLSGRTSSYGIDALRGVNLAIGQINQSGGISGKTVSLLVRDTAGQSARTTQEIQSLIQDENVLALIGPITSVNAAAAAAVAQENRTPLILPAATSAHITEIGDFVFRICFTDPLHSRALVSFARNTLRAGRAGIIHEEGSSYSSRLADLFAARFTEDGGEIVFHESFPHDPPNLDSLVDRAIDIGPDLLFLPHPTIPEAAAVVNRIAARHAKVVLLGADGWESAELFRLAGKNITPGQVFISSHYSLQVGGLRNSEYVEAFRKTYGAPPSATASLGYDAALVLRDAIARTPALTGEGIRQALLQTTGFEGVTGRITINEKRNTAKDVYILRATKDKFVYETVITYP